MPYIFGADGRFMQQVGREGDGPGEFRRPGAVAVLRGDTVAIVDERAFRVNLIAPDLRFVRSWHVPLATHHLIGMADGTVVAAGSAPDPGRAGIPLHRFAPDGTYILSFGETSRSVLPGRTPFRILARAGTGGLWSGSRVRSYEIERFDSDGTRQSRYVRTPDWFVSRDDEATGRIRPPLPGIAAMYEDNRGRLWVLVRVPNARWKAGIRPVYAQPANEREMAAFETGKIEDLEDVYIEVIDPVQRRVVARQRLSMALHGFLPDGRVFRFRKDGFDDLITIEIRTLHLRES